MSGACLHPPLSSSSSALPIFFFFLLHAAAVLFQFSSPTDAGGVICPPHDCGDGVKIRYPLWYNGSTAQSYASGNGTYICGHPDLAVHCNMKKQPVLRMGGDYYQVAAVDYKKGTISLKDMDLLGSSCPRARHNLTLNGLPLVAQDVSYILFFFNCTEDPSLFFSQPFHPLTCLDRYSYALVEDSFPAQWNSWLNVCEELVRSPVKKPDETHLNLTDFTRILQDGFPLELSSEEADKCRNCELKNQACGYVRSGNTANFALTCLCDTEDGRCPESARGVDVVPLRQPTGEGSDRALFCSATAPSKRGDLFWNTVPCFSLFAGILSAVSVLREYTDCRHPLPLNFGGRGFSITITIRVVDRSSIDRRIDGYS